MSLTCFEQPSGHPQDAVLWYLFMRPYKQSSQCQDEYLWVLTWGESGWGIMPSTSTLTQSVPGGNVCILGGHSIGHSKQKFICTFVLFRTVSEIELFHCTVAKLLIKRYCLLFPISVFIVQVTKLVQFTQYCTFSKIPRQHQCTIQLV